MNPRDDTTVDRLKELLVYDPDTGIFTRRCDHGRHDCFKKGQKAGTLSAKNGYILIGIDLKQYMAHRLAWLYVYGNWPSKWIDHINGDRADNRVVNLRDVDKQENQANSRKYRSNSSGKKGVCWHKQHKKFRAYIAPNRRQKHLGLFDTAEEAHAAYVEAAKQLFGKFARSE